MCAKCMKTKGLLVVLFGLAFLLQAFGILSAITVSYIWPILVIIAGAGGLMKRKCCEVGGGGSGA